ncbi:TetR/AcrR family transcriptional regulator [Mycobacterium sp.]|uniref:TetR/AcrR family transcriptional regulator n=1 Tax=Mycobacterium sp. TaxID=1785 RepID=UPI003BAFEB81
MGSKAPSDAALSGPIDGRAARWSGQRDKRRAEFVEAALRAIAEYGAETSTEQVADYVGVTRTKLYRFFDGAADLHHSIARRASDMLIAKQTPGWSMRARPMDMITATVSAHLRWRIENPNLYEYLSRHSLSDDANGVAAIHDVNRTVATNLSDVIAAVLRTFGLDERPAMPMSFGAVGFVESATTHWLNNPAAMPLPAFTAQLSEWMWSLWDSTLRSGGIHLDPHQPIALQRPEGSSHQ